MTTAAARFATLIEDPGAAEHPAAVLREGVVVQIGPPAQVDTGNLSLACVALEPVVVAQTVYVASFGDLNLILGSDPDPWHYVGAGGEPPFQNLWVNFDASATTYQRLRFRKAAGRVYVEGTIKSGANGTVIFTLPAGYRPPLHVQPLYRQVNGVNDNGGYLNIDAGTGTITAFEWVGTGVHVAASLLFSFGLDP